MRHPTLASAALALAIITPADAEPTRQTDDSIQPGELWLDTEGVHINAHGGGILFHEGTYYWYGEHKTEGQQGNKANVGVGVYTSTDLANWDNAGVALAVEHEPSEGEPESDIIRGSVIERPKVLYNERTGKFVMWFHLELKGHRYNAARTGCAVADEPTGPFTFLYSTRPQAGRFPVELSTEVREHILTRKNLPQANNASKTERADHYFARDFYGGQMARDMNLFLDDDGTAYHIYASEENYTLNIAELDETFTRHTGKYARVFVGGHREAPAMFKRDGKYHLITSGCTGWDPNPAEHAVADSIWGPWEVTGNPCVGEGSEITFGGQSTCVIPVAGKDDTFIFMADIWRPRNAIDGRYLWLPIEFKGDRAVLRYRDEWNLADLP